MLATYFKYRIYVWQNPTHLLRRRSRLLRRFKSSIQRRWGGETPRQPWRRRWRRLCWFWRPTAWTCMICPCSHDAGSEFPAAPSAAPGSALKRCSLPVVCWRSPARTPELQTQESMILQWQFHRIWLFFFGMDFFGEKDWKSSLIGANWSPETNPVITCFLLCLWV